MQSSSSSGGGGGSSGNPMNAAQIARLQQQLAQFGNRGQQQQIMNPNAMGGMGNPQQQQLQQAYMQQQQQQQLQQQNPNQPGMQVRRNSAAALAMMQQQQQQQQAAAGNSQMANANMSSYWNSLQSNSGGSSSAGAPAMDASSASSAQLAALAGMNMGGNNAQMGQNNATNMFLGNRSGQSQNQGQQQMQGMNNQQIQGMGQTTDATLLQQQIAQLQRQLVQQQQGQPPQNQPAQHNSGNFQQMQQQQLFQQMQQQMANGMIGQDAQQVMSMGSGQQQNKVGNEQLSMMMQGQSMQNMQQQNLRNSMSSNNTQGLMQGQGRSGTLNEQDLLMQQQQLLRSSGMNQNMQNESFINQGNNNNQDLMGRRSNQMDDMGQSINPQSQNNNMNAFDAPFAMDNSVSSQHSNHQQSHHSGSQSAGPSPLDAQSKPDNQGSNQKSFLDGSFAGGWQSNADLPDRRRIIFSILEVIRQMRPDTNKISQKLPHMAKSLEEHLYRSAQTKEEYLDPSTLKKRLQLIAHGLELHRSTSSGSVQNSASQNKNRNDSQSVPSEAQQLQQFLQMQGNNMNQGQGGLNAQMPGMVGQNNINGGNNQNMQMALLNGLGGNMPDALGGSINSQTNSGILKDDGSGNFPERDAAQKKKVIRQQQQRLLLLRHASKCKDGPNCKTKFCGQMMTLWKHMKKCRDKNCKTSHCLSSRCVLNHYRICKSQGRTATCEVCGPVMEQIKRQDHGEGMDSSDPLAAKPDPDLPNQGLPQLQNQMSNFGQMGGGQQHQQNNVQAMQQQAMQQLYQQQQLAIQQNQQGLNQQQNLQQNNLQALGGGMMQGNQQNLDDNQGQDPKQLQNLQAAQQKLYQQQQVLKQLQKQQAQLLEQQKQLQEQQAHLKDPNTQQGQQLQQQHSLLQQLQRRCQQQQALIQQELVLQMKSLGQAGQGVQGQQQGNQGNQLLGNNSQSSQHSQMGNNSTSSQHSQHSQNSPIQQNQNMQGNQLQAQMQALSQSHMQALNDNKGNDAMNQMQQQKQQLEQLQKQMQNQQSGNQDQLQQSLQNQSFNDMQGGMQDQQQNDKQEEEDGDSQDAKPQDGEEPSEEAGDSAFGNISQPMSQPLSDGSEKGAKKRNSAKARSAPSGGGRGKGMRGRGGKGKRLRDIADDLAIPANQAGASINKSSAEAAAMSVLSKKRSAGEMGENDDDGGPSAKNSKTDSGDGPLPDTEKSEMDGDGQEGDQNSSLASSMPKGDVEQHLLLLHKGLHLTSRTITHKCLPIVQQLIDDPFGWVFRDAVDPVVFGLPDYFEVVKNPMHLLLVKKKLENAVYTDMASFERDVKLVFENAILYNGEESEVGQLAHTMMGVFEREYKKVCEVLKNDLHTVDPKACSLCGMKRRQFEPPVLYCIGMSCGMQRIKRNAKYFTDSARQNCWCELCYSKLKDKDVITLDDDTEIRKSNLQTAKHDSLPEETWIECDDCKSRVHKICALYNGRCSSSRSTFWCPKCILKNTGPGEEPADYKLHAKDLPKCKMSDFMEEGLEKTLVKAYNAKAKELGVPLDEVEKAQALSVRVMSHIEKKHTVRDMMYKLYSKSGCPPDYPVHTKCVGLFQSIGGVDALLFAMYVYEYGHECPAPNRRRVYISYLDSVQYFEPKMYRTTVYQAVIVEYLRFVKKRGFHTAHIWSCPPTPGDEYVFYCHPPQQKIPQEDMLRDWYLQMLDKAQSEGVVVETTNLYDEYFNNEGTNAPTGSAVNPISLPYFEGDYIPGEIETILSHFTGEEWRQLQSTSSVPRRSGSKLGTRSNPGQLVNQSQDKVMLRLGKTIYNMKDNFMIVRLRSKRFVAAVDRGDDVSGWPDDDDWAPQIEGKDSSILTEGKEETGDDENEVESSGFDDIDSSVMANSKPGSTKIGSTTEEDEQFESEMFENRQLFLNYCQVNHCQFDGLRRAKYSTMMVLFQLHNPTAPKFIQQCAACDRDIASGIRYHCKACANYDLCEDCYRPVVNGDWVNRGSRFTHDSNHPFQRNRVENSIEAKKNAKERAKTLKVYLQVLDHAGNCRGAPACKLNNCDKMKKLFIHVKTCDITHRQGCKICARLLSLIIVHARTCTIRGLCSLPFCDRIRERNERLRRQQQLMDDRRRQAQNEHYGAMGE